MKNDKVGFLLCALFFIGLALLTFRCTWPVDHVFSASDLNIGRLAFKKHYLPESLTGFFTANQVMGSSGSHFILFNVLLALMPLEFFANTFYGLILVMGSCSLVWFLRLWGRSWTAAMVGALVAFWFNSVMLASSGHAYKMEVLAFSVLSLCFIEKAIRASTIKKMLGFGILCGISVGIMMMEQQDVALLAGLFIGPYAIFRLIQVHLKSVGRWVSLLFPLAVIALLISGNAVMGSYRVNIKGAAAVQERGDGSEKWNYITQWSMVPDEWPDLIASGWSGWGSNNPEGPYWGKIGQSAEWESTQKGFRNFKITSVYFGIIPFLMGAFGLVVALQNRKEGDAKVILFWSVAGLVGFWLAFGKYSILYKMFFQLPLVNNIRAPMKFLDNFQVCLGIVAAFGLDSLLDSGKGKKTSKGFWITGATCAGLMLLAGLRHLIAPASQIEVFKGMGYAIHAPTMVQNMSNAWVHAALLAFVCAGLVFAVWKGLRQAKWVGFAFVAVLALDSLLLTSHYFKADNIASLKRGNVLTSFIKQNQGNERTFFVDQGGIYNQWLASDGPYHGLNLFNIWQMPRMPVEYKEYLGTVGRNQIRLWQLSAVKYVAAPAQVMQQLQQNPQLGRQFKPVLNYKVPTAQGMRSDVLLEFTGTIPRFALFQNWESALLETHCDRLVSPQHNPLTTVLVDTVHEIGDNPGSSAFHPLQATVTTRNAVVETDSQSPSILRFCQRYQARWKVFVDGRPAPLLRLDYLSMGVHLPAGKHTVEFRCVTSAGKTFMVSSAMLLSIVASAVLLMPDRKRANC